VILLCVYYQYTTYMGGTTQRGGRKEGPGMRGTVQRPNRGMVNL
jgi:hypothetical protein